jgi:hypothetical protein
LSITSFGHRSQRAWRGATPPNSGLGPQWGGFQVELDDGVAGEGKNGQDAVVRPHCLSHFAQRQRVGSEEIKHPHLIGGLNLNPLAAQTALLFISKGDPKTVGGSRHS